MKRWLTRILICLFLGAVSTIAVAWTLALTIPNVERVAWTGQLPVGTETPQWAVAAARSLGALGIVAIAVSESGWAPGIDEIDESQVPNWSRAAYPPTRREAEIRALVSEDARGLPMLSLYWRETYEPGSQPPDGHTEWGWEIESLRHFTKEGYAPTMPLAVIWPGFLINTLFYGVLWLGLIVGLGAARRGLRTRRGRCPKCAYDLRGELANGCPECWWGRES